MTTPRRTGRDRSTRTGRAWSGGRLALIGSLVALSVLATAPSASAHSTLVSSDPVAGAVLATPPTTITLTFSQHVLPDNDEVAVTVGGADPVVVNPRIDGPDVIADLGRVPLHASGPQGGAVTWKVGFRIVSADGHPVTGVYSFTVGTGAPAAAASGSSSSGGSWMWPAVGVVVVLLAVAALVLIRVRRNGGSGRSAVSTAVPGA